MTCLQKLRDLSLHLKAMLPTLKEDAEISELSSIADKVADTAQTLDAMLGQAMEETVYWMDMANGPIGKLALHAAPVNIASGLKQQLFDKMKSVILTSATLCTTGFQPVRTARKENELHVRQRPPPALDQKRSNLRRLLSLSRLPARRGPPELAENGSQLLRTQGNKTAHSLMKKPTDSRTCTPIAWNPISIPVTALVHWKFPKLPRWWRKC